MPVHTYTNWNKRSSDLEEQIEPLRKYYFICEGANTETFYFKKLIDLRKNLGIHPLIDIRLWEKTDKDRNISFAKNLVEFANKQKELAENDFDVEHDRMIIVFDGDIFEEKVEGYDKLIEDIEKSDIAAVSNPNFELFLLLHKEGSYEDYIKDKEEYFLNMVDGKYSYAKDVLLNITGMNSKKNPQIGDLAKDIMIAIKQEKYINQDIYNIKGRISSNIGLIIEGIIKDNPYIRRVIR
jgi:hypothetical protein